MKIKRKKKIKKETFVLRKKKIWAKAHYGG
jgi:hypothetical protein